MGCIIAMPSLELPCQYLAHQMYYQVHGLETIMPHARALRGQRSRLPLGTTQLDVRRYSTMSTRLSSNGSRPFPAGPPPPRSFIARNTTQCGTTCWRASGRSKCCPARRACRCFEGVPRELNGILIWLFGPAPEAARDRITQIQSEPHDLHIVGCVCVCVHAHIDTLTQPPTKTTLTLRSGI